MTYKRYLKQVVFAAEAIAIGSRAAYRQWVRANQSYPFLWNTERDLVIKIMGV